MEKVVDLLQCQLSEGAVTKSNLEDSENNGFFAGELDDLEEGELPDNHGECLNLPFSI